MTRTLTILKKAPTMQQVLKLEEAHITKTLETFRKDKKGTAQISCVHVCAIEFANTASEGKKQEKQSCQPRPFFLCSSSQARLSSFLTRAIEWPGWSGLIGRSQKAVAGITYGVHMYMHGEGRRNGREGGRRHPCYVALLFSSFRSSNVPAQPQTLMVIMECNY